jgi:hypothetical protein
MRTTRRPAAAWAAGACAAGLLAAGAVVVPAAAAATDPTILIVDPVPTDVLASAGDLADLGTAVDAHLAGDNVFVEVRTAQGLRVFWRPLDGGAWSNTWGGRTLTGNLLAAEHDALLLDVGTSRVLAWTRDGGGSRTLPDDAVLGQGAQYVAFTGDGYYEAPGPVTQLVTGGDQIPVQPRNPSDGSLPEITSGFAIAGETLYGVDVFEWPHAAGWTAVTGNPWPAVSGDPCDQPRDLDDLRIEDARGRFALASCQDGVVGITGDSTEVYRDVMLAVPMERDTTSPRLGEGFVLGVSTTRGDLLAAPTLGGKPGTLGQATAFDVDDAGTAVVLVDDAGDVRIARDLRPWSSTPATEIVDHAPPVAHSVGTEHWGTEVPDTARIATFVQARDVATPPFEASGVDEEEIRYRIRLAGETEFSDWMPVPAQPHDYPAPSRICWIGRVTDVAGNASDWTGETCEDTVGTTSQVEADPLPAAVKADADGRTTVWYRYGGAGGESLGHSDVRYRTFVPGETPPDWTVQRYSGGVSVAFPLNDVPTDRAVCFQARGYDVDGSVSDWVPEQCTYTDGLQPSITGTAYPRWIKPSQTRVVDGVRTADPVLTWTSWDDVGIEGYPVQRSLSRTATGAETPVWTTATSYTRPLTEAGQHCLRVRAKDLAGNLGPWSGWNCSTMPVSADKLDGQSFGPYHHRVWPGTGDLVTTRSYSGVAIYAKVSTGPRYGSMKVYMGSRFLGTVNAHAAEAGSKWVWLSPGDPLDGKVRFVANAGDFVDLREFYISR